MTDREPLDLDCIATYLPKKFSYNLSISWTIVDPLVLQAVQEYRLSLSSVHKGISVPKAGQQQNRSLLSKVYNNTQFICMLMRDAEERKK